jgi:hypothetical protein
MRIARITQRDRDGQRRSVPQSFTVGTQLVATGYETPVGPSSGGLDLLPVDGACARGPSRRREVVPLSKRRIRVIAAWIGVVTAATTLVDALTQFVTVLARAIGHG